MIKRMTNREPRPPSPAAPVTLALTGFAGAFASESASVDIPARAWFIYWTLQNAGLFPFVRQRAKAEFQLFRARGLILPESRRWRQRKISAHVMESLA